MTTTHVSPKGAIQAVVEGSGKSKRQVSTDSGYNKSMLGYYTSKGVIPNIGIMAKVASVCGYTLQLVKGSDTIIIDPEDDNG